MSVVVAGGTKGIGLELAHALTEPGENIVIGYGSDDTAAELARTRLETADRIVTVVREDVGTPKGVGVLISAAAALAEPIRVLVHSTVRVVTGPLMELSEEDLAHTLAVNATSLLWLTRAARPHLERGSSVLYLTSRGVRTYVPGYGTVGPAKSYADGLIRYLAVELAPHGIRVNGLAPSTQDTDALRDVFGDRTDEVIAAARAKNPSGRLVEPNDYCATARFLASREAAMITGQTLFVYGGADLLG
jgi:NAD(P)-dependent dehydrogenase (short-subunit alcohol dehydrogenase family)